MSKKQLLGLMTVSFVIACMISYLYAMGVVAMFGELLRP
jgi:hypothetical protein